jgi:hypothetical protein
MSNVIEIGRNAPCPCGSGKKHKRCCGRDAPAKASGGSLWQRLNAADARLVREISEWAFERYGPEIFEEGWCEFLLRGEDEAPESEPPDYRTFFFPWVLFDWIPAIGDSGEDADGWPAKPVGLAFLEEHGDRLDALERRLLEEVCSRPFSFHQVLGVERHSGLQLRDLLSGEEWRVSERLATESVTRGEILFARVVGIDDVAILLGCAPHAIPPTYAPTLLGVREEFADGSGWIPLADLRDLGTSLRLLYFDIADQILDPMDPELRNTDGDRLELIELRYALRCPAERAFEALRVLAVGHTAEDLLADAELDEQGRLRSVSFPWLVKGNKKHENWENTILGHVTIEGDVLTVDVNSRRRARRIRKRIESRLGGDAAFEGESCQTAEELFEAAREADAGSEDGRTGEERERLEADPEVRALTERMRREHWEHWLDMKVPALAGVTPREAARDPRSRERLEALLLEFEWRNARGESPMSPDVDALRRELGI